MTTPSLGPQISPNVKLDQLAFVLNSETSSREKGIGVVEGRIQSPTTICSRTYGSNLHKIFEIAKKRTYGGQSEKLNYNENLRKCT